MDETPSPAAPVAAGENVLGIRIVAGLIDLVLLIILGVVISTIFGEETDEGGFVSSLNGWVFWLYIALCFAYYFALENAVGQTLGKKVMGIKVVALEGALTPQKVAVRTLLRAVDGFPWVLPNLLGTIVAATSSRHQRIGDMAAATIVVRA